MHVGDREPSDQPRRIEPVEAGSLGKPLVELGAIGRVGAAVDDETEGDQVEGRRLDRAPLGSAGVLDSVGIDSELVDAEVGPVAVLAREHLAIERPAGGRAGEVGVRRSLGFGKEDAAARARAAGTGDARRPGGQGGVVSRSHR